VSARSQARQAMRRRELHEAAVEALRDHNGYFVLDLRNRDGSSRVITYTTEHGEFVARDGLFLNREQRAEHDHEAAHEYMSRYEEWAED
jgi:hypothetical protein